MSYQEDSLWWDLPLCRDAVGVFYSPNRLSCSRDIMIFYIYIYIYISKTSDNVLLKARLSYIVVYLLWHIVWYLSILNLKRWRAYLAWSFFILVWIRLYFRIDFRHTRHLIELFCCLKAKWPYIAITKIYFYLLPHSSTLCFRDVSVCVCVCVCVSAYTDRRQNHNTLKDDVDFYLDTLCVAKRSVALWCLTV